MWPAPGRLGFCLPDSLPAAPRAHPRRLCAGAAGPCAHSAHGPPRALPAEQNYCESRYHFLHSRDGEGCANMLVEYSTARGFRSEVDMFVAQAVLQ